MARRLDESSRRGHDADHGPGLARRLRRQPAGSRDQYNIAAGIEILEHYPVDYAIRRGEHGHPGGLDNLVRAKYGAYNGGPRHLSRHRNPDTPASLRAIDDAFLDEFTQIRDQGWPPIARCFSVTN